MEVFTVKCLSKSQSAVNLVAANTLGSLNDQALARQSIEYVRIQTLLRSVIMFRLKGKRVLLLRV